MFARIATFEGGDTDRLQALSDERMASGDLNPPEGVRRVTMLADRGANRRMFISFFDSKDAVEAAEARFESMGDEIPADVRGNRVSVDVYEVMFDQTM
jgi:hypothetical protein